MVDIEIEIETRFYDNWGRQLEGRTCEYCGKEKPIKHVSGLIDGKDVYTVLMVEYTRRDGSLGWMCKDCSTDIKNKIELDHSFSSPIS